MKTLKTLGLTLIFFLSFSAQATDVPYGYVDIGYSYNTLNDTSVIPVGLSGGGFKLAGSVALAESAYAFADYAAYGLGLDVDLDYSGFGIGYRHAMSPNSDITFDVAYRRLGIDIPGVSSESDSGYGIGIGFRSMMSQNFELGAKLEVLNIDGSDTLLGLNGTYYFNNGVGFGAETTIGDALRFSGLKARYKF